MSEDTQPWFTKLSQGTDSPKENGAGKAGSDNVSSSTESGKSQRHDANPTTEETRLPDDTLGLALSGGGIRSAAFSMGVVQALAQADWLQHVDYLSTVSGGGYTGAFLGRFYDQTRAGDGLQGPDGADPQAAQRFVKAQLTNPRSLPNSWIRKHANYLAPTGVSEQLYNFSTYWRNLISILLVLIFFGVALFGLAAGLHYSPHLTAAFPAFYDLVDSICPISMAAPDWLSPFLLRVTELSLWLGIVPLVFAYWLGSQDRAYALVISYLFALMLFAIGLLFALGEPVTLVVFVAALAWTVLSWKVIKIREGLGDPTSTWRMALGRNQLTNWLASAFAVSSLLLFLTLVDSVGTWLARGILVGEVNFSTLMTAAASALGLLLAATPVVRTLTWYLAAEGSETKGILAAVARIPYLPTFAVLVVGVFLPLCLISLVVQMAYGVGYSYIAGLLTTIFALVITLLLGTREAFPFVNRSGPLTVYAARLARVFLGAVNPHRLRHLDGVDVGHVIEGDDTPMHEYKPHAAGGPLHLLNVAVNETYDELADRGVNARQSQNFAVGPVGVSIATDWHATWEFQTTQEPPALRPLVDHTSIHPLASRDQQPASVEPLSLRHWMAISGAAVSPGQGRSTSLARTLVLTMTNLRLGYWWDSGVGFERLANVTFRVGWAAKWKRWFAKRLQGQSLILSELRARFGGPWRRFWYLSDGGHFEYSGAYELLRRRVPFIVICDAGADKAHFGEIMADLTRIARIDWGAEIDDIAGIPTDAKKRVQFLQSLGVPASVAPHIGRLSDLVAKEDGKTQHHAALLRVHYVGQDDADAWHGRKHSWILYLKSSLNGDESIDILNYRAANPSFPNQSTLDQFFNEEQWESYRKLGEHVGSQVFE